MTVEIRHLRPGDEAVLTRVAEEVFDHPIDPATLARYLASPGHLLVVAVEDGLVVGQVAAIVHHHPDGRPTELYVDEVAVTPARQRQGIARRMLDAMLALGREQGCREMWVGTEPDNVAARALYKSLEADDETFVMYVRKSA
jgi:ribosomal protein S18 acetylase RimI-like enzyme